MKSKFNVLASDTQKTLKSQSIEPFMPESKNPLLELAHEIVEETKKRLENNDEQAKIEKGLARRLAFFIGEVETIRFKQMRKASHMVTKSVERWG